MTYATPAQRSRLIAGLRDLAAYLEAHPEVPAPPTVDTVAFAPAGTDAQMRAEIERIASLIDSAPDPRAEVYGYHRTARDFGPVQYRAVAAREQARPDSSQTGQE